MSTIDIRLPDHLKAFLEAQAARRGYADASEFVQALLEAEQHRQLKSELEQMLLETADGPFSDWTEDDVNDVRRGGKRLIQGRRAR